MYIIERHANIVYVFLNATFVVIRLFESRIQIQLFLYLLVEEFFYYFSRIRMPTNTSQNHFHFEGPRL